MAKRGNGEGSISKRKDGTWLGQVTIGRDGVTGKLKRKSVYGKTRKEVADKINELQNQVNKNSYVEESKDTFSEWAYYWLENFKKNDVSKMSYQGLLYMLPKHIDTFADVKLKDVTTFHIQQLVNDLRDKGYARDTIKKIHNQFNQIFEQAVKMDMIYKNPCTAVVLPKSDVRNEAEALSRDEQEKLVRYCMDNGIYLFVFLLATGLRIGESLAFTWDNVDFENKILIVCQNLIEPKGKAEIKKATKTASGMRTIPITPKIDSLLRNIRDSQEADKNIHNLLFYSKNYNFLASANIRRKFKSVCKHAGIEPTNLHTLRHSFATRMLEAGADIKTVSVLLGHKNIQITLDTYSHVLPDLKKETMIKIDDFI